MKDQLKAVRDFIEHVHEGEWAPYVSREATLAALTHLEAMVGEQEPVAYYYQKQNCFGQLVWNVGFVAPGDATHCYPLYTAAPVAQQPQAEPRKADVARTCPFCNEEWVEQPQAEAVRDPEAVAEGLAQIIFEAINPGKVWTYQSTDTRNAYWSAAQVAKEFLK